MDRIGRMAPPNRLLAPLIPPGVHEHANEPRLLAGRSPRKRFRGAGRLEKGVLDEIERVISMRDEPPGQPVQPVGMPIEEGGQAIGLLC